MNEMKTKIFEGSIKAFNDQELTIDHFISTENPDRVNDVMDADGMIMDGIPTVLKQHGQDVMSGHEPIAKPLSISVSTDNSGIKGILVRTQYYDGKNLTPPDNTGQRLYEKAKEGFMPYWSIGFSGIDASPRPGGGLHFKKWKLFEYSQVGVPENIEARVIKSMDAAEVNKEANNVLSFGFEKANPDDGGTWKFCVCKDCGHAEDHTAGEPCGKCPECGTQMTGSNEKKLKALDPENTLAVSEMATALDGISEDLVKSGLTAEDVTQALKTLSAPYETNLKSIAESVAMDIPWDAMSVIWWAMLDELFMCDGTPKAVKAILKEMNEIITPFAEAFALATTDDNDGNIAIKSQITKMVYIDTKVDVAQPGLTSQVDKDKSPSAIVKAIMQLQKKAESKPKSILNISKDELVGLIKDAVSTELKSSLDKMKGKV